MNQTLPVGSCEAASETSGAEDAESEGKPPLLHIVVHMDQVRKRVMSHVTVWAFRGL